MQRGRGSTTITRGGDPANEMEKGTVEGCRGQKKAKRGRKRKEKQREGGRAGRRKGDKERGSTRTPRGGRVVRFRSGEVRPRGEGTGWRRGRRRRWWGGGSGTRGRCAGGGRKGEVARKKKKSPLVARRSAVGSNRTVLLRLASASGCLRVLVAPGIVPVGVVGGSGCRR